MTHEEILFDGEERMEKASNVLRDELRGLRTGRATPALVDSIRVEYYGSPTPLKQMAQISTPDPQQIVIRPFDQSVLKEIEKAIRSSDLGMSPNNDGKMIRLQVPPMSGEQRQKMVTRIKKLAEEAKVAIRNVRRDANKNFDLAEKAKAGMPVTTKGRPHAIASRTGRPNPSVASEAMSIASAWRYSSAMAVGVSMV